MSHDIPAPRSRLAWLAAGVLEDRVAHMRHQALYCLVTGRRMTGREAAALGLAAQAVPADALESATLALAREIARRNALALAAMKQMARHAMELPLRDGLRYERWMQHRYRTQSPALEAGVHGFE